MSRRRKKFIESELQLRIVFMILLISILALLINLQMSLTSVWSISAGAFTSVENALDQVQKGLVMKFLITAVLTIPLCISAGILFSFRFAGPIYKFKKYFRELVHSRWDERCRLRKGDDLKDLCEAINDGLEQFRGRIRESHGIFQEIRRFLEELGPNLDEDGKAQIDVLMSKIDEEERIWAERFPSEAGSEETSTGEPENQMIEETA